MRDLHDNSKNLFLEEAALDGLARDFGTLEVPLEKSAFSLVGTFVLLIAGAVFIQIFFVGALGHELYAKKAIANARLLMHYEAQRGIIFDRFGAPLTENIPSYTVAVRIADFMRSRDTEREHIAELEQVLNIPSGSVESLIDKVNLETQDALTVAALSADDAEIVGRILSIRAKSIYVKNAFRTAYKDGPVFAHVLGYVGMASKEDIARNRSLRLNSSLGKNGLELQYDSVLRGKDGVRAIYRDVSGRTVDTHTLSVPVIGDSLHTTIDAGLQKYFYERLMRALKETGGSAAVGIALNPQNGEVFSMVSVPSFDSNNISPSDLASDLHPLFNRAISGAYSPGSTIKPLHGIAALAERVVEPSEKIFSRGYISVSNMYEPEKPYRFADWKPHGWVDIYSALARSSNIYFYAVGGGLPKKESRNILENGRNIGGLGADALMRYWKLFGLGKKTGIDLPGEKSGFLPSLQYGSTAEQRPWGLGDTYIVSIGQGELLLTPLQLINHIASIGSGGKAYRPFVMRKIVNSNGETIQETKPTVLYDNTFLGGEIKEVQKGMEDTVKKQYGSAYMLSSLKLPVSAKTGTAQIDWNKKINAMITGYAPASDPSIAFLVLIENAREGSLNTIPPAKDILQWYYENRILKTPQ